MVEPMSPALENLLLYHETGGHKGDGSDDAFRKARGELDALKIIIDGMGKRTRRAK